MFIFEHRTISNVHAQVPGSDVNTTNYFKSVDEGCSLKGGSFAKKAPQP
jgi:hypothetical protein